MCGLEGSGRQLGPRQAGGVHVRVHGARLCTKFGAQRRKARMPVSTSLLPLSLPSLALGLLLLCCLPNVSAGFSTTMASATPTGQRSFGVRIMLGTSAFTRPLSSPAPLTSHAQVLSRWRIGLGTGSSGIIDEAADRLDPAGERPLSRVSGDLRNNGVRLHEAMHLHQEVLLLRQQEPEARGNGKDNSDQGVRRGREGGPVLLRMPVFRRDVQA